jgi:hypothetical protein
MLKMGDLPAQRVEPLQPFLKTGVDYGGGPILIKQGNRKGKKNGQFILAINNIPKKFEEAGYIVHWRVD